MADAQSIAPDNVSFEKPADATETGADITTKAPEEKEFDRKVEEAETADGIPSNPTDPDLLPESKKGAGLESEEPKAAEYNEGNGSVVEAKAANGDAKDSTETPAKSIERDEKDKSNRGSYKRFSNAGERSKNKFAPDLPESRDPDEIRKQVEFYFTEENLANDRFLFNEMQGSKNKPIPIKTIADFKRMRHFKPFSAIVAALEDSTVLEVVDKTDVKRKEALPEEFGTVFEPTKDGFKQLQEKVMARSIYAKGFGLGSEKSDTQLELEQFFEPYGPVKSVRLRRVNNKGLFKGSVFVEFDSEETQQAFLALDPKPKYNGEELLIEGKKQYCDRKVKEKVSNGELKERDAFKDRPERNGRGGGRGRGRGNDRGRGRGGRGGKFDRREHDNRRDRRDRDADDEQLKKDWRERRAEDQKADVEAGKGNTHKRAREDGDAAEAPEAKKTKENVAAGES